MDKQDVKSLISMYDVAERYGMEVNRAGFIHCPFHAGDSGASLKIYPGCRGWYCFGCGEGGDVISFVQKLFGLDFMSALRKLNDDFGLNLPGLAANSPSNRAVVDKAIRERRLKNAAKRGEYGRIKERWFSALDHWIEVDRQLKQHPETPDDELSSDWVKAIHEKEYASYMLDKAEEELRRFEQSYNT